MDPDVTIYLKLKHSLFQNVSLNNEQKKENYTFFKDNYPDLNLISKPDPDFTKMSESGYDPYQ